MIKFKVKDRVRITAGKDKGREGEIERIFPKESLVLIPGVSLYKRHIKGIPGRKAGIYEIPRPLNMAKIVLICPKCKKLTRVGFKSMADEKVRICRKCGREIDKK